MIFLAVFVAAVTKQIDEVEDDDAIEIRPMIETNERLKVRKPAKLHTRYRCVQWYAGLFDLSLKYS